jgi:hypothetical protein
VLKLALMIWYLCKKRLVRLHARLTDDVTERDPDVTERDPPSTPNTSPPMSANGTERSDSVSLSGPSSCCCDEKDDRNTVTQHRGRIYFES